MPGKAVLMAYFLQLVVAGVGSGFVVGLLALSLTMIYRSTRVLSFAQGAIASLATYVYFQLQVVWHWKIAIAFPVALAAGALIGIVCERVGMRPLRRADALTRTVATLGIVIVLQMVMRSVWGGTESFVPPISRATITAGAFGIGAQQIIIAGVAIAAAALFGAWTRRSYRGLGLSAMAQDPSAARLMGVDPNRAGMLAWGIGGLLAALAGILSTPTLILNPLQMTLIMVTALGAALLGGFQSLPLALAGGVMIGVVQSVGTGYITVSGLSEAFGFIAVFVVLLLTRGKQSAIALPGRGGGV